MNVNDLEKREEAFPIYIGYDDREADAAAVCRHSLIRHSTQPLFITDLLQEKLRYTGLYRRKFHESGGQKFDDIDGKPFSTAFSFTRFLVPAMQQYKGWALFCDCDMLFRDDLRKIIDAADERYAVMVVKHLHNPTEGLKMDGQLQERYHRKNWSSFVLWNCAHPANMNLTVDAVNTESGGWLHAFSWLKDDEIGGLPEQWNWLEGWSGPMIDPANVHFTRGTPDMEGYRNIPYADEYRAELALVEAAK